jgi:hypothetical protein
MIAAVLFSQRGGSATHLARELALQGLRTRINLAAVRGGLTVAEMLRTLCENRCPEHADDAGAPQ